MKKKLLLLFTLLLFNTSHAFIEEAVYKIREHYKTALNALEPYLPDIIVTSHTNYTHDSSGCHTNISYDYSFYSKEAETNFATYQNAESLLNNKIMGNALGDGFILGIMAAIGNKVAGAETLNKKIIVPMIAGAIALVLYQNHKLGTVPYLDSALNKYDNQFENISFYTVGRILSMLASATVGYFGTSYTLTKIAMAAHEIQNNKNQ